MPSSTSTLRLEIADLERLLFRFRPSHVESLRLAREGNRLLLRLEGLRLPTPLLPAIAATFEVKAGLVEGLRNVVGVHLVAEKLPLGLQALANPFLDKLVEKMLPPDASAYVEVRSPNVFRVHLERIPQYGRTFRETLTLTRLTVPAPDGGALEAGFGV
ncbi:MAG TPA: hypothetical protein VFO11_04845, partial [Candidatus Polarisedimenticolaceae bacterium]|nr:hypothetical protein [Candidatus Polarisedimenticolaceae bacterium]